MRQILLKKTTNHDSRIVCSGISQVAMFFWVWKIDIFVALGKLYRLRQTRKKFHLTFKDKNVLEEKGLSHVSGLNCDTFVDYLKSLKPHSYPLNLVSKCRSERVLSSHM